ncbi:MAG: hypothetical protein DRN95_00370 [Candidatus Hydrothermarchaeota archaeon]|nr:MAG: hypothetical protein DRN95_00370 [Candidatus Hydrothermarchaeota archaeon]
MKLEDFFKVVTRDGFIIEELELCKFMRYLDKTRIKFDRKFMVIVGKTGAGKTSILDAITFALYKRTSRTDLSGVKIEDVCKPGGYVKLRFLSHGDEYEVERGIKLSSQPYLILKKNGKRIEGNIKELDAEIENIIGLDYVGFRNSTFIRQEEMKELGSAKGSERLEIFQKLFRLDVFEKAKELADEKLRKVKEDIKARENLLEREISRLSKEKEEIPRRKEEIENLSKRIIAILKNLEEKQKEIEDKQKEVETLSKKHEEFIKIRTKFEHLAKLIDKTKYELIKAQNKRKEAQNLIELKKELENEIKDIDEIRSEKEKLEKIKLKKESLIKEKSIHEKNLSELMQKYRNRKKSILTKIELENRRIKNLKTTLSKEEAFFLLRNEGALNERITRIDKEITWLKDNIKLINELIREKEESKRELNEISRKIELINEDCFVLSEIRKRLEELKNELSIIENEEKSERLKIIEKIKDYEQKINSLGFDSEKERRLYELSKKLHEKENKRREFEAILKKLGEIGNVDEEIRNKAKELSKLKEERNELEEEYQKLKEFEERYNKAKKELDELKGEERRIESELIKLKGEKRVREEELERKKAEIEKLADEIKELKKELEKLREDAEIYSLLKDKIFHKRGVVMHALNQILPNLARETSENLMDLTDGRFTSVKLAPYESNNRYGIKIKVVGVDGIPHDVQEFSGGEKTQINAALRFAIAKELASIKGSYGRMKTLFIDEGDLGSLDTEGSRELFVRKLFDMGKFFEKIILITHLSEVAEKFEGKLRVYMTEEGKSRVEVLR